MNKTSSLLDVNSITSEECKEYGLEVAWIEIDVKTGVYTLADYFQDHVRVVCSHLFAPRIAIRDGRLWVVGFRFVSSENPNDV